jgi:hypothetical protein
MLTELTSQRNPARANRVFLMMVNKVVNNVLNYVQHALVISINVLHVMNLIFLDFSIQLAIIANAKLVILIYLNK